MRIIRSVLIVLTMSIVMPSFFMPAMAYSADAVQHFNQGTALVNSRNYSDAVSAFDKAVTLDPTYFEAWDRKADALNRGGNFSDALAASTRALEINPGYAKGWINRGQILYNIGYFYEDIKHDRQKADQYYAEQLLAFDKAVQLNPADAEAWFNKGYALAGMKHYDEALAAFDKVQSLDPAYPNLGLSQKQATVLRDAAVPVYLRYALPLILGIFLIGGIWFWYQRTRKEEPDKISNKRQKGKREE